ncbi:MAG: hypothetical protein ABIH20_06655, partial [Candidatus Diapherotrites archaeon]
PSGEQRTTNFPMVIKDYWSLLESVENIDREFNTFGDGRLNICECLNTNALDFTKYGEVGIGETLYTRENENGKLFKLADKGGCGSVDFLHDISQTSIPLSNGLTLNISPDGKDQRHELAITINGTGTYNPKTSVSETTTGKVTRISPAGTALCSLPIKLNVKKTGEDEPGPGGDGPNIGEQSFACKEGETGLGIYKKYGLQHIQYKWNANSSDPLGVKEDACDALSIKRAVGGDLSTGDMERRNLVPADLDKAPWFCDAVQSTIEFSEKMKRIEEQVDKDVGQCSEGAGFDCDNKENMNSLEMFRYVLTQNDATGYFTDSSDAECSIIEVLENIDAEEPLLSGVKSTIDGLLGKEKVPDLEDERYAIINQTNTVNADLLLKLLKNEQFKGMDIVMEIKDWKSSNVTAGNLKDPTHIGGKALGGTCTDDYVIPLQEFYEFDKLITNKEAECKNKPLCKINDTNELHVTFLQEMQKGKWKITVKNSEMGETIKELIMKKGNWPERGTYDNFWQFYKRNIVPEMYLMEDLYSEKFLEAYNSKYEDLKLAFTASGNLPYPGEYNTSIQKYWKDKKDDPTNVVFKPTKTMAQIDEDIKTIEKEPDTEYRNNVLFSIPIDGSINWGTGFSTSEARELYFNYKNETEHDKGMAKSNANKTFTQKTSYSDTKEGNIISMTESAFTWSPSDPIKLTSTVSKNSDNKNAGFMYRYNKTGNSGTSESLVWKVTDAPSESNIDKDKILADSKQPLSVLCTGTDQYNGIVINDTSTGTFKFGTLIFQPARTVGESFSIIVGCIKDSGTITAEYVEETGATNLGSTSSNTTLTLTNDTLRTKNQTRYNLANLYNRIKASEVCFKTNTTQADLLWNADQFLKNVS